LAWSEPPAWEVAWPKVTTGRRNTAAIKRRRAIFFVYAHLPRGANVREMPLVLA
jgi:hypothetical protein